MDLPQHISLRVRLLQQEPERLALACRRAQQCLGQRQGDGVVIGGVGDGDGHAAAHRHLTVGACGGGDALRRDGGVKSGAPALRRRFRHGVGRARQQSGEHRCLSVGQGHDARRLHRPLLTVHRVGRARRHRLAAQSHANVERSPRRGVGALRHLFRHPQLAQSAGIHHVAVRHQLGGRGGESIGAEAGEILLRRGADGGAGAAAHGVLHLPVLSRQPVRHGLLHQIVIAPAAQRQHVGELGHLPRLQGEVPACPHGAAAHSGAVLQQLIRRALRHVQAAVRPQHAEPIVHGAGEIAVQLLLTAGQLLGHGQGVVGQGRRVEPQIAVGHIAAPLQIEEVQRVLGVVPKGAAVKAAGHTGGLELFRQRSGDVVIGLRRTGHPLSGMGHIAGSKVDGAAVGTVGAANVQHQHAVDVDEHVVVPQKLEDHVLAVDLSVGGHVEVKGHGHAEPQVHLAIRQAVGGGTPAPGGLCGTGQVVERQEVSVKSNRPVVEYCLAVRLHIAGVPGPHDAVIQLEPPAGRVIAGGIPQRIIVEIALAVPLEQPRAAAAPHGIDGLAGDGAVAEQIAQTAAGFTAGDAGDVGPLVVLQRGGHAGPRSASAGVSVHRGAPAVIELQRSLSVDGPRVVEQLHGHVVRRGSGYLRRQGRRAAVLHVHIDAVLVHLIRAACGVYCGGQQRGRQHQRQQAAQYPQSCPSVPVHRSVLLSCVSAASLLPFAEDYSIRFRRKWSEAAFCQKRQKPLFPAAAAGNRGRFVFFFIGAARPASRRTTPIAN